MQDNLFSILAGRSMPGGMSSLTYKVVFGQGKVVGLLQQKFQPSKRSSI
jgi:hypothetical protein